jgi:hypothetical protein
MRLFITILVWIIAIFAFFIAVGWAGLLRLEQIYKAKSEKHIS